MSFYDSLFGGSLGDDAPPASGSAKSTSGPLAQTAIGVAPTSVPAPVAVSSKKPVIPAAWNQALAPPPPPQVAGKPPAKPTSAAVVAGASSNPASAAHSVPQHATAAIPAGAPNNSRKAPTNVPTNSAAAKKRGGPHSLSDPYAIWDTPYDPNFPTDYSAYREWRDHLRKLRPPPPPPLPAPATAPSHRADPDATDVDRVPPANANAAQEVSMSESSSESESSEEEMDGDDEEDLDGEPMGDLDFKQFPAFLRMYLDGSMDPGALAQRLAVMIPTRHLAPEHPPPIRKSKVVVLDNMISAADVDDDVEGETIEECSKFGKVVKCLVKVLQDPPEPSVRIFVRYAKCDGAQAAMAAMNGRFFGGREVRASLYDELWFDLAKYDASVAAAATVESGRSTRR